VGGWRQNRGDLTRALPDFETAIRINPQYAHAYASRAVNLMPQGREEEALNDFDHCVTLDSNLKPLYEDTIRQAKLIRRVSQ
jgi:Tfp pilus assembly protein PilF